VTYDIILLCVAPPSPEVVGQQLGKHVPARVVLNITYAVKVKQVITSFQIIFPLLSSF
jgi:hypothetical protein